MALWRAVLWDGVGWGILCNEGHDGILRDVVGDTIQVAGYYGMWDIMGWGT